MTEYSKFIQSLKFLTRGPFSRMLFLFCFLFKFKANIKNTKTKCERCSLQEFTYKILNLVNVVNI